MTEPVCRWTLNACYALLVAWFLAGDPWQLSRWRLTPDSTPPQIWLALLVVWADNRRPQIHVLTHWTTSKIAKIGYRAHLSLRGAHAWTYRRG